jgi:hypothetical protein
MLVATFAAAASARAGPFLEEFVLHDVFFRVESPNEGSINPVTVRVKTPEGFLGRAEAEADGTIGNVEVGDLNADGHPEIYVYVNSAGSGSYGSLIAYTLDGNNSLSPIHLAPVDDDSRAVQGYMGHDEFAVGEGMLLRQFPVYREGDTNAEPTGGMRQIQYELEAGEAGWLLRLDRITDF